MDRYLSKRIIFLSLSEGFTAFLILSFFFEFRISTTVSLVIALVLLIINPLCLYLTDKRYSDIEYYINDNIILKQNVYFNFYSRPRNGYLYLTEDIIYLHSRDKKPYLYAYIYKSEIIQIEKTSDKFLNIYIEGNYIFEIKSPDCDRILNAMIKSGWIDVINL